MGPPSNLPNFVRLATDIAGGTGLRLGKQEPVDRFPGRLADKGVDVHQRAGQRIFDIESTPTMLHVDLMQLFRQPDRLRIVTTHFDLHF